MLTLKWNIFVYGTEGTYTNNRTGEYAKVTREDIDEMINKSMTLRIADGYTPKSKLASTDFLAQLMQMLGTSQILQMAYGPALPKMYAHLAQLGGVRDLEQYAPDQLSQPAASQQQGGTGEPATGAPAV
jgi:hypothetical protein